MAQLATIEEGAVARPLKILEPLIREDFEKAEHAGMPYFVAAGKKLKEARKGHFEGDTAGFYAWGERSFAKSQTQLRAYERLAGEGDPKSFESLRDHARRGLKQPSEINRPRGPVRPWTATVDLIAQRAFDEAQRLAREQSLTRKQEREADRKLALRLIDIGFKVLARELHPDKGGSRDAMARLNRVRNHLKECV